MKRVLVLVVFLGLLTGLLAGCSSAGLVGSIYTDITTPVNATSNGIRYNERRKSAKTGAEFWCCRCCIN